ncbi:MATE family efflux transporter [Demequina capsici]|uniref:Multidrug export protein MepA n=1 Tax=Demequina capsici TaxID=3075620 RepID=A0AA96FEQ9_9MICO|nr:MATE family efflux transporter [Demequina sp. PMTSA13]WNM27236.1 MATE family efflux transporter [Demequina sp. PMTSA13]
MTTRATRDHAESLGSRPIGRLLWWTCSQTTLSVGIYGVYALTNAWFVARGVGADALAAVNLVAPLLLLLGAASTTVGVGGASLVSRSLGARRPDDAAHAAAQSFGLFWATAITVSVVGLALLDPLLRLVGANDATLPYARPYAAVLIAGAIFSTGFSAIVRAEGRLLFSTMLWVIPVIVQITLDPVLIYGLHLGVVGAALGTVGGQAVSAFMALWFFFGQRARPYRIRASHLRPHARTVKEIVSIGAPSFLTGLGATLLALVVNVTLAAASTAALVGYAVAGRVQTFASMPHTGITQGTQPIISYNAGRLDEARVDRTRTLALRATVVYGALAATFLLIAAPWIAGAFVTDPATIDVATTAIRAVAAGVVLAGVPPVISACFQALGRPSPSYWISVGTLIGIKLPLVLALGTLGPAGIWIALPLGEAAAAGAAWLVLRRTTAFTVRSERP